MIKILKKEIVSCKCDDFVESEIVIDNICLAVPYDNKCDIYLANGMKLTVTKQVYNRILETKRNTEPPVVLVEKKEETWPQKIGKKFKR